MSKRIYVKHFMQQGINLPLETVNRVLVTDGAGDIKSSTTTSTELGYVTGVTSSIQTQLNNNATAISDHLSDTVGAHAATAISNTPAGNLAATEVQAALNELQSDIDTRALDSALTAHLNDTVGAHAASAISNVPAGSIAATEVQAAINELDGDIQGHITDASDAHDASAISNIPSGNLAATEVQAALNELQSDIDARALDSAVIKKDGSVAFTADQSMGGFKLTNLATPVSGTDAVNKAYVDASSLGLDTKSSVRVATVAAGTLASDFENGDTVDGVVLVTGDRILIQNQADPAENGIYVVNASGAPTRAADADVSSEVNSGMFVFVEEGTANDNNGFILITNNPITLGTTGLVFTQFTGAGQIVAGAALTKTGNTLDVAVDGLGLEIVADQLALELDGATLSKSASGLKLSDTAVTPGSFGSATAVATFTVDQQGRLTAAGSATISVPASQVSDFTEASQDAIGTILTDTASINFTYNDGAPSIAADVLPAGVDHDQLMNYVANEHIDHSAVSITGAANGGLSGGGDITASRTLSVDITNATAETVPDNADLILIYDNSATSLKKMTRANFLSGISTDSPGDLSEGSFALANNQVAPANVTGFAFDNGVVRAFTALASVAIDATSDLFEQFTIEGIQKGASWEIAVSGVGDFSGVSFSITTGGQIQYTSTNISGFVSSICHFRAWTVSV